MRQQSIFLPVVFAALGSPPLSVVLLKLYGRSHSALTAVSMRQSVNDSCVRILWGKFMAVYAMSLAMFHCQWAHAAMRVYMWGHVLNVGGINTRPNAAQVIAFVFRPDDADEHSVRDSMRRMVTALEPEVPISVVTNPSGPQPTRCSVPSDVWVDLNLREKTNKKFGVYRNAVSIAFSHCVNLQSRFAFRLEPFGCFRTPAARFILA
jgi:hypothetical protein